MKLENTDRVQFNARIGKEFKRAIKTDAARTDLTVDLVAESIIAKFFQDYSDMKREELYRAHKAAKTVS